MPLPAGSPAATPQGTPPAFRSHEFHPHFLHIVFNKIQKAERELEVKYKTAKCQVKSFRKRNPKTNLSFMFMQKCVGSLDFPEAWKNNTSEIYISRRAGEGLEPVGFCYCLV